MANLYADFTLGNEGNAGTMASPLKYAVGMGSSTSGKSLSAGDSMLQKRGEEWREQLTVPSSGSAGSPITFGAYGSGTKPVISGAEIIGGSWTQEVGIDLTGDANLQGLWYLEEATGATRIDESANNNDLSDSGTVVQSSTHIQGTYAVGLTASSSQFLTGANADLSANFPGKISTSFTVGGWVRITNSSFDSTRMVPIGKGYWQLRKENDNKYYFYVFDSSEVAHAAVANAVQVAETWYHVVGRLDLSGSTEVALFINGVKQTVTATSADLKVSSIRLSIGESGFADNYLDGLVDEAFVFNRALNDAEILSIYEFRLDGSAGSGKYYNTTLVANPGVVIYDGSFLWSSETKNGCTTGKWYWDGTANRLWIYDNPTGKSIEVGTRSYGIRINSKDYVTIQDLRVQGAQSLNISIEGGSDYCEIKDNDVYFGGTQAYKSGIMIREGANNNIRGNTVGYCYDGIYISGYGPATSNDNLVASNIVSYTYKAGITIASGGGLGPESNRVERNMISYADQTYDDSAGIYTTGCGVDNIIRYNTIFNGGSSIARSAGIMIDLGSEPVLVYYNVIYGNSNGAIDLTGTGHQVYNNTTYDNNTQGWDAGELNLFLSASSINIKNNIFFGSAAKHIIRAPSGCITGHAIDHNNYYGGSATPFDWNGTDYIFSVWQTNSSQDANSVNAIPLFINAAGGDFRLQAGSPAINAGVDVGLTQDYTGYPIQGVPDIGAYEETLFAQQSMMLHIF